MYVTSCFVRKQPTTLSFVLSSGDTRRKGCQPVYRIAVFSRSVKFLFCAKKSGFSFSSLARTHAPHPYARALVVRKNIRSEQ